MWNEQKQISSLQRKLLLNLLVAFAVLSLCSGSVSAAIFTVVNQEQFRHALQQSADNKENDEIHIAQGAVIQPEPYHREIGRSLRIAGGYDADFVGRTPPADKGGEPSGSLSAPTNENPPPQLSTSGPLPSLSVVPKDIESITAGGLGESGGVEAVLGVPGYLWRHGCGPTAVGMVAGFFDALGFPDLFPGAATSQTEGVQQGIASQRSSAPYGHYEDYSLPIDSSGSIQADRSQTGGAHTSDSIADFMRTSWSIDAMRYGWSYNNQIAPSLVSYAALKNSAYLVSASDYYMQYSPSLTWSVLTTEIDNGRPMVFLVDSDANGGTDHFVTVVGYRDTPTQQYGCLDTWAPAEVVRWENFLPMASGRSFGIYGGTSFTFSILPVRGDINKDGTVNLTDVIVGLQVVAGKTPAVVGAGGDVNADGKIGLEEVIYDLAVITY